MTQLVGALQALGLEGEIALAGRLESTVQTETESLVKEKKHWQS